MEAKTLLILIAVNLVYALIGGAIMYALESSNEETVNTNIVSTISTFLSDNSACLTSSELETFLQEVRTAYDSGVFTTNQTSTESQWNYANSIFFAMTATTTIGYGNQTPSTRGGKAFIVVYALFGIPVTALMILGVADKLKKFFNFLQSKQLPCLEKHPKADKILKFILIQVAVVTILIFLPSVIFYVVEDWEYADALYYCIITFTTIGFGDFVVGSSSEGGARIVYRFLVLIWIVVGLAGIGSIVSECTDKYQKFTEEREKKNKLKRIEEIPGNIPSDRQCQCRPKDSDILVGKVKEGSEDVEKEKEKNDKPNVDV